LILLLPFLLAVITLDVAAGFSTGIADAFADVAAGVVAFPSHSITDDAAGFIAMFSRGVVQGIFTYVYFWCFRSFCCAFLLVLFLDISLLLYFIKIFRMLLLLDNSMTAFPMLLCFSWVFPLLLLLLTLLFVCFFCLHC